MRAAPAPGGLPGATLAIEASTYAGSVAVLRDGRIAAALDVAMRGKDEERLMPAVARAMAEAGVEPRALDRVVCGGGPGSFTSLRIAASIAKGLAVAAGLPLLAVPSPLLMLGAALPTLAAGRYLAALDAMREESYVSLLSVDASARISVVEPMALAATASLARLARELGATTLGPGMEIDAGPHARGAAWLGGAIDAPAPVDVATWEPAYGRLAEAQVKWERAHGRPLGEGR